MVEECRYRSCVGCQPQAYPQPKSLHQPNTWLCNLGAQALAQLMVQHSGVLRWLIKIDDEHLGRGHAYLDVAAIPAIASAQHLYAATLARIPGTLHHAAATVFSIAGFSPTILQGTRRLHIRRVQSPAESAWRDCSWLLTNHCSWLPHQPLFGNRAGHSPKHSLW